MPRREPRVTPRRTRIAMPERCLQDAFADTLAQQIGRAAVLRSLVEARLGAGRGHDVDPMWIRLQPSVRNTLTNQADVVEAAGIEPASTA